MALYRVLSEIFNIEKYRDIEGGTIRQIMYGFLLLSYSNFVSETHRFFRYSTSKIS